jgi:RHS repeat-associated protein
VPTKRQLVHTDHLGTPQLITDSNQNVVWDATYDPFGQANITIETVTNNLRFPGQLYDEETGLHHNGWRTYDPSLGRYLTSDSIGLLGGTNTYIYVSANPILYSDPTGLKTFQCTKPLDAITEAFGSVASQYAHDYGPYLYHQYSCVVRDGKIICGGQDRGEDGKGKPSNDRMSAGQCELTQPDNDCFEECLLEEWEKERPDYGIPFGTDCQEYDDSVNKRCRKKCNLK